MEGITNNTANAVSPQGSPKGPRPLKPVLIAFGAVVLLFAGYMLWLAFWSPEAIREFEAQKNLELAQQGLKDFNSKLLNDTYGGKTPKETLDLFIAALEKGDIDLASKYFAYETGGVDAFNLSKWKEGLQKLSEEGGLLNLIMALKQATTGEYSENYTWYKKTFYFNAKNDKGEDINIVLVFNHLSGVWKIENL